MASSEDFLRDISAAQLAPARALVHKGVQHLSKAARANLPAKDDDSHSNLGWNSAEFAFQSQPLGESLFSLSLAPLAIFVADGGRSAESLDLDGLDDAGIAKWLDQQLTLRELQPASTIDLPYDLPAEVAAIETYDAVSHADGLVALSKWYDGAAAALAKVVEASSTLSPGASPVRCWPHHFDIATYVALETGDAEVARGIGVGMSPGDESYPEPYFYINPWPHLESAQLPPVVAPGHWHVDGYVGLIATASELRGASSIGSAMENFVLSSFATARAVQASRTAD